RSRPTSEVTFSDQEKLNGTCHSPVPGQVLLTSKIFAACANFVGRLAISLNSEISHYGIRARKPRLRWTSHPATFSAPPGRFPRAENAGVNRLQCARTHRRPL